MFMVCWHYCMSFLIFLNLTFVPIFIGWGAYVMKRGLLRRRQFTRKKAVILWAIAGLKFAVIDISLVGRMMFCQPFGECGVGVGWFLNVLVILCTISVGVLIYKMWNRYVPDMPYQPPRTDPRQLALWTRAAALTVTGFVIWVAAPWISTLVMGRIPAFFLVVSWPFPAVMALVSLCISFWKLEDVQWLYSSTRSRRAEKKKVWIPKDTLWTLIFVYIFTVMLAFASSSMINEAASRL